MRHKALRNSSKSVGIKFISDEKYVKLSPFGADWWKMSPMSPRRPGIYEVAAIGTIFCPSKQGTLISTDMLC